MKALAWHQVFSDYHNIGFQPNGRTEKIHIKQNLSGEKIQVELSNQYDPVPLNIHSIQVSRSDALEKTIPLTYKGEKGFSIAPGHRLWTDEAEFVVSQGSDLIFEISVSNERNALASSANLLSREIVSSNIEAGATFLYGLTSVRLEQTKERVVTLGFFGDSLTNQGYYSDQVLKVLYQHSRQHCDRQVTGFNAGISGNRLLLPGTSDSEWRDSFGAAAVKRFDADIVSRQPDLVVGWIGLNDLFHPGTGCAMEELPTADEMMRGYQSLFAIAKQNGIRYIPITLSPFAYAANRGVNAWSQEKEEIRLTVNEWLRCQADAIDMEAFLEDPHEPGKLNKRFDCGDHLHFSEAGGRMIGSFIADRLLALLAKI